MYGILSVRLVLDLKYCWYRARTANRCLKALQVREIWLPNLLFQILDYSALENAKHEIGFENKMYARSSTVLKAKLNIYSLISKFIFLVSVKKLVLTSPS